MPPPAKGSSGVYMCFVVVLYAYVMFITRVTIVQVLYPRLQKAGVGHIAFCHGVTSISEYVMLVTRV